MNGCIFQYDELGLMWEPEPNIYNNLLVLGVEDGGASSALRIQVVPNLNWSVFNLITAPQLHYR